MPHVLRIGGALYDLQVRNEQNGGGELLEEVT